MGDPAHAARLWLAAVLAVLAAGLATGGRAADVVVVFFFGEGCPHCAAERPLLEELAADPSVTLLSFEVYRDASNRRLFAAAGHAFGFEAGAVPTTLVGDEVYVGFSDAVARRLRERVTACLQRGCPDPMERILASAGDAGAGLPSARSGAAPAPRPDGMAAAPGAGGAEDGAAGGEGTAARAAAAPAGRGVAPDPVDLPVLGRVALAGRSELVTTALIAFVDGFNPCSLWVLSLLLAVVINTRSRRKVALVGLTFLLVAAAVYALMLAGLVNVLGLVSVLPWVRTAVAALALGFALVNLKDYVWYRQGLSLTIPEGRKPGIYRGIRGVMARDRGTAAMLGATAAMAAGVTVFELPCTVGFPVLWADLVLQWHPGALAFGGLLLVYLVVFLLDELALFGAAVVTLRATRLEERHGRVLKLVGGMVMLFLAAVMVLRPSWMNELGPASAVVGAALLAALLVHAAARALGLLTPARAGGPATARSGPRSWERASRGGTRAPRVRRDR